MSIHDGIVRIIAEVSDVLGKHAIANHQQEAKWLVFFVAGIPLDSPADLAHYAMPKARIRRVFSLARKRIGGVPLAVLLGETNFFGYNFFVNKNVLIPRIDSEVLVERFLESYKQYKVDNPVILDICSGSGCLSISASLELRRLYGASPKIILVDVSKRAMDAGLANAKKFLPEKSFFSLLFNIKKASFENRLLSLLKQNGLSSNPLFIISNPPYIKTADLENMSRPLFDPRIALDGGESGLDFYKRIFDILLKLKGQASLNIKFTLLEIGSGQADEIALLLKNGMKLNGKYQDLERRDRVIEVTFAD